MHDSIGGSSLAPPGRPTSSHGRKPVERDASQSPSPGGATPGFQTSDEGLCRPAGAPWSRAYSIPGLMRLGYCLASLRDCSRSKFSRLNCHGAAFDRLNRGPQQIRAVSGIVYRRIELNCRRRQRCNRCRRACFNRLQGRAGGSPDYVGGSTCFDHGRSTFRLAAKERPALPFFTTGRSCHAPAESFRRSIDLALLSVTPAPRNAVRSGATRERVRLLRPSCPRRGGP